MKTLQQIISPAFISARTGLACLVTGLMIATSGCENDEDDNSTPVETNTTEAISYDNNTNTATPRENNPIYVPAGIIPQDGDYSLNQTGRFSVGGSGSTLTFSRDNYAVYSTPIWNSEFCIINGDLLDGSAESTTGNMYPTDGFGIWGKFTSETTAEGMIYYSYGGHVTEGPVSFSANK